MNFKTNKDIITRAAKDFIGIIAVGAMFMLITLMFFAESFIFSKEVIGLLVGVAILFLGIGGLSAVVIIASNYFMKKIAKLEKTVAEQAKTIANYDNQLRNATVIVKNYNVPRKQQPQDSRKHHSKNNILEEISSLSEETSPDEAEPDETLLDDIVSFDAFEQENTSNQEAPRN